MVVDLLTVTHAPGVVDTYEWHMRMGAAFPPISVVRVPGRLLVADGHKRLAAYRRLGEAEIVVEVWPWRRWWADQWRQAINHGIKVRRVVRTSVSNPREVRHLWLTTTGHWRRVARSLSARVATARARAWRR